MRNQPFIYTAAEDQGPGWRKAAGFGFLPVSALPDLLEDIRQRVSHLMSAFI